MLQIEIIKSSRNNNHLINEYNNQDEEDGYEVLFHLKLIINN